MPNTIVLHGNGVQTRFEVPGSLTKTVRVAGVITVPASQDFQSVTLSAAPGNNVPVQIDYTSGTTVLTGVTYDASSPKRVTAYTINGVAHLVTYPSALSVVDTGGGVTHTTTLDADGFVTSVVVS